MLPKTPNVEPETSSEALVVKSNHPFHKSGVGVVNVTSQSKNSCATNQPRLLLLRVAILVDLLVNLAGFSHCYLYNFQSSN